MSTPPIGISKAEHISKNHVRITVAEGQTITVFNIRGSSIEVIIASNDGQESTRMLMAAPAEDETVQIDKACDGSIVDIFYKKEAK